ncbi:hypothetical protein B0H19DRAFT_1067416 [Mycena capillaripes]|nr:hypothetical protein B0H19DRAFT_1067416 [Mycena capillaripes]
MPAESFIVQAAGFPLFHPKDCPAVVDFLGGEVKVQTYAYWSGTVWIRTDLPVTIKANTPLYLRSTNVTVCLNGPTTSAPTTSTKRKHSLTVADSSPSPQRPRIIHDLTSDNEEDQSVVITVASPIKIETQAVDVFCQKSSGSSPSKKSWPLKYFCDMHTGFTRISDSSARTTALKFEEAFEQPFVKATYYENFGKWKSLSADAQMQAVAHGCTPEVNRREYLQAQVDANEGFGLPHLASSDNNPTQTILMAHARVTILRHNPVDVPGALDMIVARNITVNWGRLPRVPGRSSLRSQNKKQKTLEEELSLWVQDGLIQRPNPEADMLSPGSSPLSSPSRSVSPIHPTRPNSAMSGVVEEHKRYNDIDVDMTGSVNPESGAVKDAVLPIQSDIPENNPIPDDSAPPVQSDIPHENLIPDDGAPLVQSNIPENIPIPNNDAPAVPIRPDINLLRKRTSGPEDVSHRSWSFVAQGMIPLAITCIKLIGVIDDLVDNHPYSPKVVVISLLEPRFVNITRLNSLDIRVVIHAPAVDAEGNMQGTKRVAPPTAYTRNVETRYMLRGVLDNAWPDIGGGFEVFWRLPGFHLQEDFGPIAVVLEDGENGRRHVNWLVSDTHALPICGPPLSERIIFVLQPLHSLRMRALPAVRTSNPVNGEPPAYTENSDVESSSTSDSSSESDSDSTSDEEKDASDNRPADMDENMALSPPAHAVVAPAVAATNNALTTAKEINSTAETWLHDTYVNQLNPVILEIRSTSGRNEVRAARKIPQLVAWSRQVKAILSDQTHLPVAPSTGVAGNHKITRANLAALFSRSPNWIKQALECADFMERHEHRIAVIDFLASSRVFGLGTFHEELLAL